MFSRKRKQRDLETTQNCTKEEVECNKRQRQGFSNKLTLLDENQINIPQSQHCKNDNSVKILEQPLQQYRVDMDIGGQYEGFNQYLKVLHFDRIQRLQQSAQNQLSNDGVHHKG
eukprot:TRINITY_DN4572_c1_g2_i1.p7 TRINITY_DN4572_c1_g2~~TRINITY_DN4572_c1_g2_i1.p7  ORF type:complete len:114 (-),score=10.69 TRINITY_DN4572_c1_g2_i1:1017-1358(-)